MPSEAPPTLPMMQRSRFPLRVPARSRRLKRHRRYSIPAGSLHYLDQDGLQ